MKNSPTREKNSPILCQKFVDMALSRIRKSFPTTYIIHYMDDILLAHPVKEQMEQILLFAIESLTGFGLIIALDKMQRNKPLGYLGQWIHNDYISTQKMSIRLDKLQTLNDFQKLLGNINWIRPYLKVTTGALSPLFSLLQEDSNPKSKRTMTPKALQALHIIEEALDKGKLKQLNDTKPWTLLIFATDYSPTRCLWQEGMLKWMHLTHTQSKMFTHICAPYSLLRPKQDQKNCLVKT